MNRGWVGVGVLCMGGWGGVGGGVVPAGAVVFAVEGAAQGFAVVEVFLRGVGFFRIFGVKPLLQGLSVFLCAGR